MRVEINTGIEKRTPDWQLDNMYETESSRLWELQNQEPEFDVYGVYNKLDEARRLLYKVEDLISKAADKAEGYPEEDKVMSLLCELDKLDFAVNTVIDDLGVSKC